jgi:hypothetical protein
MPAFDFIEIGTSDFETLIQSCGNEEIGMSVEPVKYYLDALPNRENVRKIHAGISDIDGYIDVFYVHPDDIRKYNLISWVRGCNSVGRPHPTVQKLLEGNNIPMSIIKKDVVIVKSIATLFLENDVQSIGYLKIDTEGHDCVILHNYINFCERRPEIFAKKIRFETNELSSRAEQREVINRLLSNGYTIVSYDQDAVLTRQA